MNASKLKAAIIDRGFSIGGFCKLIGMDKVVWHRRMSGKVEFRQSEIATIASLLKMDSDEVMAILFS